MLRIIVSSLIACSLAGCGGDIGGQYSTVTIKTDSNDANTYLLSFDQWNKATSGGKPLTAQSLSSYPKRGQGGAVVKSVPAFKQVAVVEKDGKIEVREFTPKVPECEITIPSPK